MKNIASHTKKPRGYITSLHLAQKCSGIVCRCYLFQEVNSFPRAFKENCELWGTDNVQGQIISEHIFKVKWRLLCLSSFKYFSQHIQFWKLGNILGYLSYCWIKCYHSISSMVKFQYDPSYTCIMHTVVCPDKQRLKE